jgi:hypothetical protein
MATFGLTAEGAALHIPATLPQLVSAHLSVVATTAIGAWGASWGSCESSDAHLERWNGHKVHPLACREILSTTR